MEPTIKPGTRCECRVEHHKCEDPRCCHADAVRMVTVRPFATLLGNQYERDVPMCEPCATWHEIRGIPI